MRVFHLSLRLLILFFLFAPVSLSAQVRYGFSEEEHELDVCTKFASGGYGFSQSDGELILDEVLKAMSIEYSDIQVHPCPNIKSVAYAWMNPDNNKRYLLYQPSKMDMNGQGRWAQYLVFSHEVGHHLLKHESTEDPDDHRNNELAADRFAGRVIRKLNGSLSEALAAFNAIRHPSTPGSYPTRAQREAAVRAGYNSEGREEVVVDEDELSESNDYLPAVSQTALVEYPQGVKPVDVRHYAKSDFYPSYFFYSNNSYWVVYKKSSNYSNYRVYWDNTDFPKAEIDKGFTDGYNIESLEKINGKWSLVMLKHKTSFAQMTRSISKTELFSDKVKQWMKDGYSIQNLIDYTDDQYTLLLTKLSNTTTYTWATRGTYSEFETWLSEQQSGNKSYNFLYTLKYVNNRFFAFMCKKTNVRTWSVVFSTGKDFKEVLSKRLLDGYVIENVTASPESFWVTVVKYN
jgi:hypothetical protein